MQSRRSDGGRCMMRFGYRGFTLAEVMIVVVIISILAAVAYPSYQESVRKAKRAEGRTALMQLMQQQERFYSQNNKYVAFVWNSSDANAQKFTWYSGSSAKKSAYEIEGKACDGEEIANCVQLIARPGTNNVDSGFKDDKCKNLILTSTGEKSASSGAADCW